MSKISIRIPDEKHEILATAARRNNKTISGYVRELLMTEPEKKSFDLEIEQQIYVITRLVLLSLAQSMPPDQVMDNYRKISQDAEGKFRR